MKSPGKLLTQLPSGELQHRAPSTQNIIETNITSQEDEISHEDEYSGAIKFLKSPITENFFSDIRSELEVEFEKSFRNIKKYKDLEKDLKAAENSKENKAKATEALSNVKSAVLERLSTMFLPEFLNRLDDIIIFQPLRPDELRKICDIMVKEVAERVKVKQVVLEVDDKVRLKLTREGYNPAFGARPLRRLVTKYIEDLISENLLRVPLTKRSRNIKIQLNENDEIEVKKEEFVNL